MTTTSLDVVFAAIPPLLVLVLMVGFRWGGSRAGAAGWLSAVVLAFVAFGANVEVMAAAHVRAIILTLDVVYIVWAALLLYLVVDKAGALRVIARWFTGLTGDDVLRVLLLGWVFTSFLQGVGGFGVPVAIVAPLLVGLGLSPLAAVVIPSVGHGWAVTFGSLGSSFLVLLGVTGVDEKSAAVPTALLLGAAAILSGFLAAHVYAGWRGIRRSLPAVLVLGLVMAIGQYILATNGLWNIGAAGGSLLALVVGLWVVRWPFYRRVKNNDIHSAEASEKNALSFRLAIIGYVVLVVLAFTIKGIPDVKSAFGAVRLSVDLPAVTTLRGWETPAGTVGLNIFGHTGAILCYAAAIAYGIYRWRGLYPQGAERAILTGVWLRGRKAALGILAMVAMATVMQYTGMTRALAEWLANAVSPSLYAFISAVIGALGAFMTGSNTNSNAVFAVLQQDTALLLGLSVPLVLAIQTASASVASVLAPAKIIVGASTVGMSGEEGAVLRKLLAYGLVLLGFIALLGFVLLTMTLR